MADDNADMRAHPEWFDFTPVPPTLPADLDWKRLPLAIRRDFAELMANPPIMITRKAVPFVLPIKGTSA